MTPLKVLLIETDEHEASRITQVLSDSGYAVTSRRVWSEAHLVTALQEPRWDLVIADYSLDGLTGTKAFTIVRAHDSDVAFIFVSRRIGQDHAVAAMQRGADDYVLKDDLTQLPPAVTRALHEANERRDRTRANERLTYLAYHDAMTDLPNRALLSDRLQQAILVARREDNRALAVLLLDLDGFKEINDVYGHFAGDLVLQQVATRLRGTLRESDTIARLGGDEFAMLLPKTDIDGATLTAKKLLRELGRPFVVERQPVMVHGSIGIAVFPLHGCDGHELLQKADVAMYRAKSDRSGYGIYTPDHDPDPRNTTLATALRDAVERGQFVLEYQPQINLRSGVVVGVEALLRWDHPQQGRLLPQDFIHLAEHTGEITAMTTFAIGQALSDWACEREPVPISVSVNLSPRALHDPVLPAYVRDRLSKHGVNPTRLTLEITENLLMTDPEQSARSLRELRDMGVRIVVDDFGTGYSSLSYLRRLPVDGLKIDQSFVIGLANGEDDALVRSIIDLAHNLRLTAIAEGVETEAVRDRLVGLGCDAAQGHFISRPGSARVIGEWIARTKESGSLFC